MSLSTPVGFLIFNRPDLTEKVFEAIAQAQPKKLFVIADGPRFPEEAEKCEKARSVIKNLNWDCEISTNFSDKNLGCGLRESSGFDWVFSQVEEAIFLEDDTLPSPSFFHFCQKLLEYYRKDNRIMHINGDNSLAQRRNKYSYYFSKYMHGWGWASWRRAWKYYDYNMKTWPDFKNAGLLDQICDDPYEKIYWSNIFDQMYQNPQNINTWDYQWLYACWAQNGLVIAPNVNLVSNLGFNRSDATHTPGNDPRSMLPITDVWDIKHPPFVVRDKIADLNTFDFVFNGKYLKERDTIQGRIRNRLSSIKRRIASKIDN
jgi:hypothetical protein